MQQIESIKESGGYLNRYTHNSNRCHCEMTFSVYLPPQAEISKVPALYWLSGLTCSDDNARTKAGMQRYAAEHGIAIVFPDTSPRGADVADDAERYDLGQGAGFYVNATQAPWATHYQMYDYIVDELPQLIAAHLPILADIKSISGHSMGGHGALICALNEPNDYCSVSAFAPVCNPIACDLGRNCLTTYLGDEQEGWNQYDATKLIQAGKKLPDILIDQGTADEFYAELFAESFQTACLSAEQKLTLRLQEGYDHSYHFVASFVGEHIAYHAKALHQATAATVAS